MDPYEKRLFEETAELSRQNNKILRSMQRAARWSQFFSTAKWVLIIALTIGTYYYVQPYLNTLLNVYRSFGGTVPSVNAFQEGLKNFQEFESSVKNFGSGTSTHQ